MDARNEFERLLQHMDTGPEPEFKQALIEVCDTAYACKTWFESYGVSATAADVVALAKMVIAREAELRERQERAMDGNS